MSMTDQMTTVPLEDWVKLEAERDRLREEKRELVDALQQAISYNYRETYAHPDNARALLARVSAKGET